MLFSVLIRKGKVPRHNFYPPRSPFWLRGGSSQLTPSSGLVPRPCPAVIAEGGRHPTQLALRLLRPPKGGETRSHRLQPRQTATAIRSQRQEWGRGSLLLQGLALPVCDLGEGSRALQDIAPMCSLGPPVYPLVQGQVS